MKEIVRLTETANLGAIVPIRHHKTSTRKEAPVTKPNRYAELAEAFRGLGMTDGEAKSAAHGRESDTGISTTVAGPTFSQQGYTADDFALVLDPKDDTTWFYLLKDSPGGSFSTANIAVACRAMFNADTGAAVGVIADMNASTVAAIRLKLSTAWNAAVAGNSAPPTKPKAIA